LLTEAIRYTNERAPKIIVEASDERMFMVLLENPK
jgi:hypothetical protein